MDILYLYVCPQEQSKDRKRRITLLKNKKCNQKQTSYIANKTIFMFHEAHHMGSLDFGTMLYQDSLRIYSVTFLILLSAKLWDVIHWDVLFFFSPSVI